MRVRENALCESCCANPRLRRRPSTYDDSRAHSRRVDHADMDRCDVRTSPVCPLIPFPRPVSKVIPNHEAAEPHGEFFVCAETTVGARFVVSISLARDSLARDSLCRMSRSGDCMQIREIRCVGSTQPRPPNTATWRVHPKLLDAAFRGSAPISRSQAGTALSPQSLARASASLTGSDTGGSNLPATRSSRSSFSRAST